MRSLALQSRPPRPSRGRARRVPSGHTSRPRAPIGRITRRSAPPSPPGPPGALPQPSRSPIPPPRRRPPGAPQGISVTPPATLPGPASRPAAHTPATSRRVRGPPAARRKAPAGSLSEGRAAPGAAPSAGPPSRRRPGGQAARAAARPRIGVDQTSAESAVRLRLAGYAEAGASAGGGAHPDSPAALAPSPGAGGLSRGLQVRRGPEGARPGLGTARGRPGPPGTPRRCPPRRVPPLTHVRSNSE